MRENYTEFEFCIDKLHEIYISVQQKSITTRIIYYVLISQLLFWKFSVLIAFCLFIGNQCLINWGNKLSITSIQDS